MSGKKYIVEQGDSGLYNLYRKVGVDYVYQMSFVHYDIAKQACHLLNLEAIAFDGMRFNWKKVCDEFADLKREFFEYRLEHPADEEKD